MKNIFYALPIAAIAKKFPLAYFDIGSRGGFQSDLHPIAFAVDVVGFEPDPVEFERLRNLPSYPWRSAKYLPQGVSSRTGRQKLYIPTDPQSASLLKHNAAIGDKFDKPQFFSVNRTEEIQTLCLDDALKETNFGSIDVLKIDIEGTELAVFKSSSEIMNDVLAVKTEISFIPFRRNQPLASDVDAFLRESGFELMDIVGPAHWRRHGYLIHPYYSSQTPPYSRAQIVQADYLYIRNPDSLGDNLNKLLKLALISAALGYFDHALMILERPVLIAHLEYEFGSTPIEIIAPASRIYGRKAFGYAFY
ncbi:MAG: FkbM family methyltransferase, partial [Pseudomonadota bacterium]|nr:FkbM family methyltransferase [Pseudomonadota bacterium]